MGDRALAWYTYGVAETPGSKTSNGAAPNVGELVQLVKDYARQETLGPLRGAGRWIAFGIVGALLIGAGTAFLSLGVLRLVQTEWPDTFAGRWMSLLPYLFAFLACLVVAGLAFARISKRPLNKEHR